MVGRGRHRRAVWIGGLGVLVLAALGGWAWWWLGTPRGEAPQAPQDPRAEQIARGSLYFQQSCVSCHTQGGIGPELTRGVLANYRTADRLFRYVSRAMPYDAPGSLEEQTYWDIVAFLLAENGMLPDDVVLGPETAPDVPLRRR